MIQEVEISLGAKRKISPETIIMLKSDANYTNVYLIDGSHFLSSITLGKLAKRLEGFEFFRPNRSVLVNEKFIQKFSPSIYIDAGPFIQLLNHTLIPISRRKVKNLTFAQKYNI